MKRPTEAKRKLAAHGTMKFHIRKVKGGFRYRIKSTNGKIPGNQVYSRRIDIVETIEALALSILLADGIDKLIVYD